MTSALQTSLSPITRRLENKFYMALPGKEGLNKVREGGQRTPGLFHSKGVSPSAFRK